MSGQTIILAVSQDRLRDKVAATITATNAAHLLACTADLMNTFNEVESHLPDFVIISSDLTAQAEFEVMYGLFSSLNVRWVVLTETASSGRIARTLPQISASLSQVALSASLQEIFAGKEPRAHVRPNTNTGSALPRSAPLAASRPSAPIQPAIPSSPATSLIMLGASTGGIDALITVLSQFSANCPPTLIVQHTGVGFGESLAALLNRQSKAQVRLAEQDAPLEPGQILIGAGLRQHLTLSANGPLRCALVDGPPVSGHLPSVDILFRSGMRLGNRVSAALLTGMGRDGADGLGALRQAGAHTIAQDQTSSVVYGMPRAAAEIGAAREILPLERIAQALHAPLTRQSAVNERANL